MTRDELQRQQERRRAAKRLVECLDILDCSQLKLARILDCDPRLVRRWVAAENLVPPAIMDWIERWVRNRERYPDPAPPDAIEWKMGASKVNA